MNDFYYRKLNVYHQSLQLVADIYQLTKSFPDHEQYGLTNQIQRAAVSVPSNIAEGMGRFSNRERVRFLEISNGSAMEVMCQLEIALRLGYVTQEQFNSQEKLISEITRMLVSLRNNIENKI